MKVSQERPSSYCNLIVHTFQKSPFVQYVNGDKIVPGVSVGLCVRFSRRGSSLIENRKDAECILMEMFSGGAKACPSSL